MCRTVDKLVDGINKTTDDLHMWLCPFTPGAKCVFLCTLHILDMFIGMELI